MLRVKTRPDVQSSGFFEIYEIEVLEADDDQMSIFSYNEPLDLRDPVGFVARLVAGQNSTIFGYSMQILAEPAMCPVFHLCSKLVTRFSRVSCKQQR